MSWNPSYNYGMPMLPAGSPSTYGMPATANDLLFQGQPSLQPTAQAAPAAAASAQVPTTGNASWGSKAMGWLGDGNNLNTVFQGFQSLTNAYLGYQALKQAKASLAFQKDAFNRNFNNSVKTYNNSLEDRIRGRQSSREASEGDIQSYLSTHRL